MKVRTVALLSKSKYRFLQMTILLGIVGIVGWLTACSGLDGGYTVTFESNGGSAVSSQQVEAGGKAQAPDDPAKENKYFAGWYSDSTFNNPYEFNKFTLIENITLYAKWDDLIDISSLYTITVAEKTATAGEASVLNLTVEKNYVSLSVEDYTLAITARPTGASINALTINVEGQIAVADTVASADAGDYTIEAKGKNAYTGTVRGTFTLTVNAGTSGNSIDSVTIKEGTTSTGADPGASITKAYGEALSFNAVVAVTGSPDESISWTTSDNTIATVTPSGTANKQVTVTIVNSSGDATIIATSQADGSKTDSLTITAEKKSISSVAMPYTDLTIDEGAATGNTAATVIGQFLVGSDTLAEAVDFTIAKKSGTSGTGPDPGTNVTIDPATGTITIAPAQTAFTATTYTVTMTGKGHYKDSKEADITLTVNATSTAVYGVPASITATTNTGSRLALSWDEFDSDTDTPSTRSTRTT